MSKKKKIKNDFFKVPSNINLKPLYPEILTRHLSKKRVYMCIKKNIVI